MARLEATFIETGAFAAGAVVAGAVEVVEEQAPRKGMTTSIKARKPKNQSLLNLSSFYKPDTSSS
jgi:hypothetical protein